MRWTFFLFSLGCGGTVAGPVGDGGDTDGGTDGTIGIDGGGSNTCAMLATELSVERTKLQICCPTCKSIQCMGVAKDVCCTITINSGDLTTFDGLVAKYKAQCNPICPGAPCPPVPSGKCLPSQTDPNAGLCQ